MAGLGGAGGVTAASETSVLSAVSTGVAGLVAGTGDGASTMTGAEVLEAAVGGDAKVDSEAAIAFVVAEGAVLREELFAVTVADAMLFDDAVIACADAAGSELLFGS